MNSAILLSIPRDRQGGFQYEDEPDELLIYVDHAACFSVWAGESIKIFESLDLK